MKQKKEKPTASPILTVKLARDSTRNLEKKAKATNGRTIESNPSSPRTTVYTRGSMESPNGFCLGGSELRRLVTSLELLTATVVGYSAFSSVTYA